MTSDQQDIERVLEERLAEPIARPAARVVPRELFRRLLVLVGLESESAELRDRALTLIDPLGIESSEARDELVAVFDRAQSVGIVPEHVVPVTQAYLRGLSRIVEAESELLRTLLREQPAEARAATLDQLLATVVPLASEAFDTLHRAMLHTHLLDDLVLGDDADAGDLAPLAVALVDLSGSTRYLAGAGARETQELVDGLFEAGQGAVMGRPVRAVKYVGDGFFVVGRDAVEVADASFAALDAIHASLPLAARAGLAYGGLVRRAGDYFGLAVNLAQVMTKLAAPRTVVGTVELAEQLPADMRGPVRQAALPGSDTQMDVVELRRPTC